VARTLRERYLDVGCDERVCSPDAKDEPAEENYAASSDAGLDMVNGDILDLRLLGIGTGRR
jgi:hypothetical protein